MQIEDAILSVLYQHRGMAQRIRRRQLAPAIRPLVDRPVSDRLIRETIEVLRTTTDAGARICSTTRDGGGYWIAADDAELEACLAQDENRIRETAQRIRAQRKRAGLKSNLQMSLAL